MRSRSQQEATATTFCVVVFFLRRIPGFGLFAESACVGGSIVIGGASVEVPLQLEMESFCALAILGVHQRFRNLSRRYFINVTGTARRPCCRRCLVCCATGCFWTPDV